MTGGGVLGSAVALGVAAGLFASCGPQAIHANAARHKKRARLGRADDDVKEVNRQDAKDAKRIFVEEPSSDVDLRARRVIGAAIEVHRMLGPGFLEGLYEEALCMELSLRGVPFARQVPVGVNYKGRAVGQFRIDLVVDECLIVELKTVESLAPIHLAQLLSYLKATQLRLGLVITFNVPVLMKGVRRVIHTP